VIYRPNKVQDARRELLSMTSTQRMTVWCCSIGDCYAVQPGRTSSTFFRNIVIFLPLYRRHIPEDYLCAPDTNQSCTAAHIGKPSLNGGSLVTHHTVFCCQVADQEAGRIYGNIAVCVCIPQAGSRVTRGRCW
jgi:hypothetical protein